MENELSEIEEDEEVDCTEQVTPESRLENSFEVPERRRKRKFCENVSDEDPLPAKYRHIRSSEKKVKPEYYTTVDKIKSTLHCSYKQAAHSVIMVANGLFGRKWKTHDEDENNIDVDTAPHKRRTIEAGHALTALCLSEIVDEMMKAGGGVITYQDDGSRSQGVGGYSVQGININGKFRPLPTLPVASECRENLAALKLAVLSILATCNQDYTATEIHERVTFKVTDATSHNFDVDEMVALKLGTEHVPVHLLCHTHPVLMFNRKIVEVCSEVEKSIGPEKIYSACLVNATTTHDSVLEQYIDCVTRLVSSDYNHKSWNYSKSFELFLENEKNKAKALRKERFNRFVYLAAVVLHHQEQVQEFLQKYDTVTNTLACIVRAFAECEFLSVLLTVTALIGIQLVEPYLSVTYFDPVDYEELVPIMRQLYEDLKTTDPSKLLDTSQPSFKFIDAKGFGESMKWDKDVLSSVNEYAKTYNDRVVQVLSILLPRLAE